MKTQNKTVEIKKIKFDEDLYPRIQMGWQTAYDYSQSMRTGTKFPPIVLALSNNKLVLIDGWHRINACKNLKKLTIEAEIHVGWSRKQMFEEAIRRNISHGRVLSPYEKRRIALKLRGYNYPNEVVSELIQVPLDKLENFIGTRLVNSLTGEVIVKSGMKHLAGQEVSDAKMIDVKSSEKNMYIRSQIDLIEQLINLIGNGLIDLENETIANKLEELKQLL